jgi:hypothetical protein
VTRNRTSMTARLLVSIKWQRRENPSSGGSNQHPKTAPQSLPPDSDTAHPDSNFGGRGSFQVILVRMNPPELHDCREHSNRPFLRTGTAIVAAGARCCCWGRIWLLGCWPPAKEATAGQLGKEQPRFSLAGGVNVSTLLEPSAFELAKQLNI